jgi:hypothetical protein
MSEAVDAKEQKPDMELEKFRIRFGFYKVLFGAALVGLLSVVVPGAIEFWRLIFEDKRRDREIRAEQINQHQSNINQFIATAINQDIELRIRFAKYFAHVSDNKYRNDWENYLKNLLEARESNRRDINSKEDTLRRIQFVSNLTDEQKIVKERLLRELEWLYREIGYVARDRSIVPSRTETRDAERPLAATGSPGLVRIVMHWTGGGHRAAPIERTSYHEIVEGDGTRVRGIHPPEANAIGSGVRGAAHTLNLNRGSIGLAMAGMMQSMGNPFNAGPNPITNVQLEVFCTVVAEYVERYNIPITRETVLTHAEVEPTLGVRQRGGRPDIRWLPGMAQMGDPIEVGDRLRAMIRGASDGHCRSQAQLEPVDTSK